MKDQFVTFEIAEKLKELGFNEECFSFYWTDKVFYENVYYGVRGNGESTISAPLWQQAIDWIYSKTPEGFKCVSYITDKKLLAENIMAELYLMEKFSK